MCIFRNLSLHSYSILLSSASVSLNTDLWIFNKVIPLLSPWGFSLLLRPRDTFDMSFFFFYGLCYWCYIFRFHWISGSLGLVSFSSNLDIFQPQFLKYFFSVPHFLIPFEDCNYTYNRLLEVVPELLNVIFILLSTLFCFILDIFYC